MGREGSNPSPAPGEQPVESWKRAAEVTSALKAKIEQMKVSCAVRVGYVVMITD